MVSSRLQLGALNGSPGSRSSMSGSWTHASCRPCFDVMWSEGGTAGRREPYQLAEAYREAETCCFCGAQTAEGIYVRADPKIAQHCGGHDE
jgi:hypothetical protein